MNFDDLERLIGSLPRPLAKLLRSSFVRYVIGGCIAASAHLAVVATLVEIGGADKENANSLGFVVGVLINYTFQRRVTFREHAREHSRQMPLFIGFALIGLGINRFVYGHGIHDFHLQYLLAAAMAILVVFIFNFTANSLITFRPRRSAAATASLYSSSKPSRSAGAAETIRSSSGVRASKRGSYTDP
ncbi:MAG: GtrA family protein [Granulosicoccaceae bacterium]